MATDQKEVLAGSFRGWSVETGPRGAMIDWGAILTTLPEQFKLDSLLTHKTAGERPRAYHRR